MRTSKDQKRIIEFLKNNPHKTATEIGMALSRRRTDAKYSCQWASSKCLLLLKHGILNRSLIGEYSIAPEVKS